MTTFITASDGTVYRATLFNSFSRHRGRYVAELDTPYGSTENVYFDSWEIEGLLKPAALPCGAGYYVLRPISSEGEIEGAVRIPIIGWTTDKESLETPIPLTLDGPVRESPVLCPDGQVVDFDTIYSSVDDYLQEARRLSAKTKAA